MIFSPVNANRFVAENPMLKAIEALNAKGDVKIEMPLFAATPSELNIGGRVLTSVSMKIVERKAEPVTAPDPDSNVLRIQLQDKSMVDMAVTFHVM